MTDKAWLGTYLGMCTCSASAHLVFTCGALKQRLRTESVPKYLVWDGLPVIRYLIWGVPKFISGFVCLSLFCRRLFDLGSE